jgi:sec-independent protein translocase protein TatA
VIDDPADAGAAVRSARVRVGDARSLKRVAAKLGGDLEIVGPDAARHAAAVGRGRARPVRLSPAAGPTGRLGDIPRPEETLMLGGLTGWHLLALVVIILLLFGAAKLPALAKSVGQSARVFKGEMKAMKEDDAAATPPAPPVTGSAAGTAASSAEPGPDTKP